jgi:hypothetical protein
MSNKLYVGNLSFRVNSEDLQEYFAGSRNGRIGKYSYGS